VVESPSSKQNQVLVNAHNSGSQVLASDRPLADTRQVSMRSIGYPDGKQVEAPMDTEDTFLDSQRSDWMLIQKWVSR